MDWQTWEARIGAAWRQYPELAGHGWLIAGGAATAAVAGAGLWLYVRSRRPDADEIERRRRNLLAERGRIVDGVLVDARSIDGEESNSPSPEVLVYRYRLAGVTYECAQDVSTLPERVRGWQLDQSVSVRYDTRNPGNSVIVAESWTGLS